MSIVVLEEAALRQLITDAVREAMGASNDAAEYMTIDQTAKLLGSSTASVRTWVRTQGLPAMRLGGEWRFQRAAVVRWLEERAVTPGVHVTRAAKMLKLATAK